MVVHACKPSPRETAAERSASVARDSVSKTKLDDVSSVGSAPSASKKSCIPWHWQIPPSFTYAVYIHTHLCNQGQSRMFPS